MVPLRWVKFLELFHLGHDLGRTAGVMPIPLYLLQHLLDNLHLFLVAFLVHDYRSVLGSRIVPLAVQSGRIMQVHEDIKNRWVKEALL